MRRIAGLVAAVALALAACGTTDASTDTISPPLAAATSTPTSTTSGATSTTPVAADWTAVARQYAGVLAADADAGGAIVAIWRDGTLSAAAAGTQPDGTPIPVDGAWRIGSVTKIFLAASMLRLVDEGLIDLDAPAADYLDNPTIPESVSVRDLLGHTSGIFNYTEDVAFVPETLADLEQTWDPADIVERALAIREVAPDPQWSYSNTNYLVVGLLVESVTGQPVEQTIADLTADLGLGATYLAGTDNNSMDIGAYSFYPGRETVIDASFPYTAMATGAWTAGAMVSDAADLTSFLRALFAGDVISQSSLDAMTRIGAGDYGLGIARVSGTRTDVFGHNGSIMGFFTTVAYSPEKDVAVVVGMNTDNPPGSFDRQFQALLVEALAD